MSPSENRSEWNSLWRQCVARLGHTETQEREESQRVKMEEREEISQDSHWRLSPSPPTPTRNQSTSFPTKYESRKNVGHTR